MDYLGYFLSIIIGITLGFFGSGGSILAVPVLVYVFCLEPVLATFYSLFIVSITSAFGSINYIKNKLINHKIVLFFGVPSVVFVLFARKILLPNIPNQIAEFGRFIITKNIALMVLFAVLMITASYSMIKKSKASVFSTTTLQKPNYFLLVLQGSLTGFLTGLVGAGGGFLIIPALVLLIKLPIKQAMGTSLIIIFLNTSIGFLSDINSHQISWQFLFSFLVFSVMGVFIGIYFSNKINPQKLKPYFGYFIMVMGIFILIKELFLT